MARENKIISFLLLVLLIVSTYAKVKSLEVERVNQSADSLVHINDSLVLELNSIKQDTFKVFEQDSFVRTQFSVWLRNTYPNCNLKLK